MKKVLLAGIIFFFISISAFSQNICTQTLRQARIIYDEGRLHELPSLLESCLKDGFTDEEKTEAYRLLTLSYIYLDEQEKADKAILALLNHNHEFSINPQVDPAEFINLYSTFRTRPLFRAGLRAGGTYSFVNVINSYGVHNLTNSTATYKGNPSFEVAGIFEKSFGDRITGVGELVFQNNKFTYTNDNFPDDDGTSYVAVTAIETQTWLALNLLGQYRLFKNSRLNPHVMIGPSVRYLLLDEAKIETQFRRGGEEASGADEPLTEYRNPLNIGVTAGASIKKKLGKQYVIFEIKYNYGFTNITKTHNDGGRLSTYYGFALNDMTVSHLTVSTGLLFQYFKPKKLTTKTL